MKTKRLPTVLLCTAALVALATGCTSSTNTGADHATPTATVQQPTSAPAPTPSAPASPSAAIPDLPPAEPGTTTLASVPLRTAGTSVAALSVKAGDLIVTIMCTGGPLVLHMEPVSTTTIPCAASGITPTRNNFHLGSPKDINVSVDATAAVQWNMRIEQ